MRQVRLGVLVSTLTVGGAEQLLLELLRHLDRHAFSPHVFFLQDLGLLGEELEPLRIETTTNIRRGRFNPGTVLELRRRFLQEGVEALLLINHRDALFYGVPAARLAGIRCVVNWENETLKRYSWHWLTMALRRVVHWDVDAVVAAARGHKEYIARVEGIPSHKIHVIYNGVDPERFRSGMSSEQAKAALGLPKTSMVVGIIAVLRPDKAHEVLLRAASIVVSAIPDVHFLIIGDGPRRDELIELAKRTGLESQVHFLGFRRDLENILPAMDVNVLSSRPMQETLSVAALEAMSVGIPMICTRVGFMDEIVLEGRTGFLLDVDDDQALAHGIVTILQDDDLRTSMGRNAAQLVQESMTARYMAAKFEQLFLETLNKRGLRRDV